MITIEIHIPRPKTTFFAIIALGVGIYLWNNYELHKKSPALHANAAGGPVAVSQADVQQTEEEVRRIRREQMVLDRKEEILRYQLLILEEKTQNTKSKQYVEEYGEAAEELLALLQDEKRSEEELRTFLRQLDSSQEFLGLFTETISVNDVAITWPIKPDKGISARFHDTGYKERFGFEHNAVDIPTDQNTVIYSAAPGTISKVSDNGYGYSYLVIDHGGYATIYGHISNFLVHQGDSVQAGEAIALSGGMPGSRGAGRITTGPHLHFEIVVNGEHKDPLNFLPEI